MLRPSMPELIGEDHDTYTFVVSVAKRAREISEEMEEKNEIVEGKPVRLAIDEIERAKRA